MTIAVCVTARDGIGPRGAFLEKQHATAANFVPCSCTARTKTFPTDLHSNDKHFHQCNLQLFCTPYAAQHRLCLTVYYRSMGCVTVAHWALLFLTRCSYRKFRSKTQFTVPMASSTDRCSVHPRVCTCIWNA